MKLYLISLEDKSKYLRDLINEDRLRKRDHKFIDSEIQKYDQKIQKLQELKKIKPINEKNIHDFLAFHSTNYKQQSLHRLESERLHFIKKAILPTLEKYGCNKSAEEIDNILLNFPEDK